MYELSHLVDGIKHPNVAFREINRKYYNLINNKDYNESGSNIIDEDWDTLIILDACRYDMFSEINSIRGDLDHRISRGSNTEEFLRGNFKYNDLSEIVYTTGNPQLYRHYEDVSPNFHKIYDVWNTEAWDEDLGTVQPNLMTERSIEKIQKHRHKRHILHYLQPHYPFIGSNLESVGREMLTSPEQKQGNDFDIWGMQMRGEINISKEDIKSAYYSNLEQVLAEIEKLVDEFDRKTIITSDHGNMLGERSYPIPIQEWGHPSRTYTQELVKVPWLTIEEEEEDRPEITITKSTSEREIIDGSVVEDRLKDLGYV